MSEPGWELYRTFLEVARDGSLSGAARTLGLTQPTAGRHIDALESALGQSLFTRSPRGLIATPAALALVPHVEAMAAAAAALTRAASGEAEGERGTVRVTASEMMGFAILPPILAKYHFAHPGVTIELVTTNRTEDLLRRDADIAVRMVRPTQSALVARHLGDLSIGLYAHRDHVERFGLPESIADLARFYLIGFDHDAVSFRSVGSIARDITRDSFGFRCDSDPARLAALRAGLGIGGCIDRVAREMPELLPILPDAVRFSLGVWLVMHEDLRSTRRVRLLYDHLADALGAYVRGGAAGSPNIP